MLITCWHWPAQRSYAAYAWSPYVSSTRFSWNPKNGMQTRTEARTSIHDKHVYICISIRKCESMRTLAILNQCQIFGEMLPRTLTLKAVRAIVPSLSAFDSVILKVKLVCTSYSCSSLGSWQAAELVGYSVCTQNAKRDGKWVVAHWSMTSVCEILNALHSLPFLTVCPFAPY